MDFNGILNVNKAQNMTSHDVVAILRRITGMKAVGHTGTLDPMANGVLPVCFGRATKMIEYMESDFKSYVADIKLGFETDTLDIWGHVVETDEHIDDLCITKDIVKSALDNFEGITEQRPPMYSAIKVNGRKLYEYARSGETVEIPLRKVYMDNFKLLSFDENEKSFSFEVRCSKGTYIRSLCRDIGRSLGTLATMTGLKRTVSGVWNISEAVDIQMLMDMEKTEAQKFIETAISPVENGLRQLGLIDLESEYEFKYLNGSTIGKDHYDIKKEPRYREDEFVLNLPDIYRNGYLVRGGSGVLGVGFVDPNKKWLKSKKLLIIPNSR